MTSDPRIDPLNNAAILTDTQVRISFAPADEDARVVALSSKSRGVKLMQMQSLMQLGRVHIQVKAGFGEERSIDLTPPEIMVIYELLDRFITELPRASRAEALPGQ
jgi:hypothetical protein